MVAGADMALNNSTQLRTVCSWLTPGQIGSKVFGPLQPAVHKSLEHIVEHIGPDNVAFPGLRRRRRRRRRRRHHHHCCPRSRRMKREM